MLGLIAFNEYNEHNRKSKRRSWWQSKRQTLLKARKAKAQRLKMKRHKRR